MDDTTGDMLYRVHQLQEAALSHSLPLYTVDTVALLMSDNRVDVVPVAAAPQVPGSSDNIRPQLELEHRAQHRLC